MKKDINLLTASGKPGKKDIEYRAFVRSAMIILIVVYILVVSGVFSFYFIFFRKEKKVLSEISQKEREIKGATRIESLQLTVGKRLGALSWVFEKEENKIGISESLRRVEMLAGDKVTLESVEIDFFGDTVNLSGSVSRVTDLIEFFKLLTESKGKKDGFDSLLVSSLTKRESGYFFRLNLGILSKK